MNAAPAQRAWTTRSRLGIPFRILVVALVLVVFGGAIAIVTVRLRGRLRDQIAGRDAQVLLAVETLRTQTGSLEDSLADEEKNPPDPLVERLNLLLQGDRLQELAAGLHGLVAARLFDARGYTILPMPLDLRKVNLGTPELATLAGGGTVSHYHPALASETLFSKSGASLQTQPPQRPILEVVLPLNRHENAKFLGAVQLMLDAGGLAAELRALDNNLARQAIGVFLLGGLPMAGTLLWALRRLEKANNELAERSSALARANTELVLAAKTSALGAVTAHLVHGIKNPVSGLERFVRQQQAERPDASEWDEAVVAANRLRSMVQDVVRVLQEENSTVAYELSWEELMEVAQSQLKGVAKAASVNLHFSCDAKGTVGNRDANLLLLIVQNLATNAVQASAPGATVSVRARQSPEKVEILVSDQGPGLADDTKALLFTPVRSTKPNGTGIGLAISNQLAGQLGATLELRSTSSRGTEFAVVIWTDGRTEKHATGTPQPPASAG